MPIRTATSSPCRVTARALRCLIEDCKANSREVETRDLIIDTLRIIGSEALPAEHCRELAGALQSLVVYGDRDASVQRGMLGMTAKEALREVDPDSQPRIMECESDWKVSPHGDADPDRDCYWVETHEAALAQLRILREEG